MEVTFSGIPMFEETGTCGSRIGGEEVRNRGSTRRTVVEATSPTHTEPKPMAKLPW
jgi:hypothetical protein